MISVALATISIVVTMDAFVVSQVLGTLDPRDRFWLSLITVLANVGLVAYTTRRSRRP
jgi:hypothetical protein